MNNERFQPISSQGYEGIALNIIKRAAGKLPSAHGSGGNYKRILQATYYKHLIFLSDIGDGVDIVEHAASKFGWDEEGLREEAKSSLKKKVCKQIKETLGEEVEPSDLSDFFNLEQAKEDIKRRHEYGVIDPEGRGWGGKLCFEDVLEIRERYEGGDTLREITKDFEVTYSTVRSAAVGETWTNI